MAALVAAAAVAATVLMTVAAAREAAVRVEARVGENGQRARRP